MEDISIEIIQQAISGNMHAFQHIYNTTAGFVYSTALRIMHNTADAEEITQEVFLKIYKNLKKFQFQSSLRTWIYRITANTAINEYRRRKNRQQKSEHYTIECAPDQTEITKFDTTLEQKEYRDALVSLLNILNPDQKICLLLREIEGLNYQEIAETLQININTVRSRLKRARETLIKYRKSEVITHEL